MIIYSVKSTIVLQVVKRCLLRCEICRCEAQYNIAEAEICRCARNRLVIMVAATIKLQRLSDSCAQL